METPDLKALRAELLQEQIRSERLKADKSALEYAEMWDKERDRLVRPGRRRHLNIDGPIGGLSVIAWLDALNHWGSRDPGEPITITINSPGGDVMDGFALYDTILRLRRKGSYVTTHGQGMVASMAAVLMQAGDERILDRNAFFMIHEISALTGGRLSDIEEQAAFMKRLQGKALDALAERSTLSKAAIARRWRKKDDWLAAEEALKLGFVDGVE